MIGHALDGDSGKRFKKIDFQVSETRLVEVLEQVQLIGNCFSLAYLFETLWIRDTFAIAIVFDQPPTLLLLPCRCAATLKNTKFTLNINVE